MSDWISRQDVLELIDDYNRDGLGSVFCSYVDGEKFKDAILELPSEQKTGKWVQKTFTYRCSACQEDSEWPSEYCPWCGARMECEE